MDLKVDDEAEEPGMAGECSLPRQLFFQEIGMRSSQGLFRSSHSITDVSNLVSKERGIQINNRKFLHNAAIYLFSKKRLQIQKFKLPNTSRVTFQIDVSFDGRLVASCNGDHNIYINEVESGKLVQCLRGHPRTPFLVKFHPTMNYIVASGCLAGHVRVWDLHSSSELLVVDPLLTLQSLSFHPGTRMLAIACSNQVLLWDWKFRFPLAGMKTATNEEKVRFVGFDSTGKYLITAITNRDDRIRLDGSLARGRGCEEHDDAVSARQLESDSSDSDDDDLRRLSSRQTRRSQEQESLGSGSRNAQPTSASGSEDQALVQRQEQFRNSYRDLVVNYHTLVKQYQSFLTSQVSRDEGNGSQSTAAQGRSSGDNSALYASSSSSNSPGNSNSNPSAGTSASSPSNSSHPFPSMQSLAENLMQMHRACHQARRQAPTSVQGEQIRELHNIRNHLQSLQKQTRRLHSSIRNTLSSIYSNATYNAEEAVASSSNSLSNRSGTSNNSSCTNANSLHNESPGTGRKISGVKKLPTRRKASVIDGPKSKVRRCECGVNVSTNWRERKVYWMQRTVIFEQWPPNDYLFSRQPSNFATSQLSINRPNFLSPRLPVGVPLSAPRSYAHWVSTHFADTFYNFGDPLLIRAYLIRNASRHLRVGINEPILFRCSGRSSGSGSYEAASTSSFSTNEIPTSEGPSTSRGYSNSSFSGFNRNPNVWPPNYLPGTSWELSQVLDYMPVYTTTGSFATPIMDLHYPYGLLFPDLPTPAEILGSTPRGGNVSSMYLYSTRGSNTDSEGPSRDTREAMGQNTNRSPTGPRYNSSGRTETGITVSTTPLNATAGPSSLPSRIIPTVRTSARSHNLLENSTNPGVYPRQMTVILQYSPSIREEEEAITEMRRSHSPLVLHRSRDRYTRDGALIPNARVALYYDNNTLRVRNSHNASDWLVFYQSGYLLLSLIAVNPEVLREVPHGPLFIDFPGLLLYSVYRYFNPRFLTGSSREREGQGADANARLHRRMVETYIRTAYEARRMSMYRLGANIESGISANIATVGPETITANFASLDRRPETDASQSSSRPVESRIERVLNERGNRGAGNVFSMAFRGLTGDSRTNEGDPLSNLAGNNGSENSINLFPPEPNNINEASTSTSDPVPVDNGRTEQFGHNHIPRDSETVQILSHRHDVDLTHRSRNSNGFRVGMIWGGRATNPMLLRRRALMTPWGDHVDPWGGHSARSTSSPYVPRHGRRFFVTRSLEGTTSSSPPSQPTNTETNQEGSARTRTATVPTVNHSTVPPTNDPSRNDRSAPSQQSSNGRRFSVRSFPISSPIFYGATSMNSQPTLGGLLFSFDRRRREEEWCRIQKWRFRTGFLPDLTERDKNVVVEDCCIGCVEMNDNLIVVQKSHGEVGVYSLVNERLGELVEVLPFPASPVSFSFYKEFLLVAFPTKATLLHLSEEEKRARLVNELDLGSPDGVTVNCMKWVSAPGCGILYGTSTPGLNCIV